MRRTSRYLLLGAVFTALLWFGGLGKGLAAIGTPTPTPTRTPTPTPDLLKRLSRQLTYFSGGGGRTNSASDCLTSDQPSFSEPTLWFFGRASYDLQEGALCLYDVVIDQPFEVNLTSPDGALYYTTTIDPSDPPSANNYQFSTTTTDEGVQVSMVRLWLSPEVMEGDWSADASTVDNYLATSMEVAWPSDVPELYVPRKPANPFILPDDYFSLGDAIYRLALVEPGRSIALAGSKFPPNTTIPIGLYQTAADGRLRPIQAIGVKTNGQGKFQTSFTPLKGLPHGRYYLGAILDTKASSAYDAGPAIGIEVNTCPGAMSSRLLVGDPVQMNRKFREQNTLLSQPVSGTKTGQLGIAATAVILEGPACVGQILWWKVQTSKGGVGWIAEGSDYNYYLVLK